MEAGKYRQTGGQYIKPGSQTDKKYARRDEVIF
jgi:hypothetical protein